MMFRNLYYCVSRLKDKLQILFFSIWPKHKIPNSRVPVGLAGCGNFVRYAYVPTFNRKGLPIGVSGLFSSSAMSSEKVARILRYKTRIFASFQELLESGIKGVILTVPNHLHYDYTIRAIDLGLDVFCEKPVANSSGDAISIKKYLENKKNILMVGFNQRYTDRVKKIRSIVENGDLGALCEVEAFHNQNIAGHIKNSIWLNDLTKSGGGILHNAGIHLVNLMIYFFGPIESVSARLENRELPKSCGEDTAHCEFFFKSGVVGRLAVSCINQVRSSYEHIVIKGTKNVLYSDVRTSHVMIRPRCARAWKDIKCKKEFIADSIFNELSYFYNCMGKRIKPNTDILDSIDTLKVIESARRSSLENKKVTVE